MKNFFSKLFGVAVGGPVGFIGSIASEFVTNWKEGQQQKRDLRRSVNEFKQGQARSKDQYKYAWELKALESTGIWMRRGTLILFSWPLFWAYFDPDAVNAYFLVLEGMPEWYLKVYFGMLGVIWGFIELRDWRAGKT